MSKFANINYEVDFEINKFIRTYKNQIHKKADSLLTSTISTSLGDNDSFMRIHRAKNILQEQVFKQF